ncbi:MAG TPA: GGDEF domain-containing protein [Mobilitalea sp.]|nr:GGDEF domain-containing protein [Mobilitalea sp.]
MYNKEIQDILDELQIIEKLYDIMRIVDPVRKKIITKDGEVEQEFEMRCFDFWGKDKVCNNCISMRAYIENQTYVKLEYSLNEIYMVTAIPIQLSDRTVVLELLKNTTDSIVFQDNEGEGRPSVHGMIENINQIAFMDSLTQIYNRKYIYEKLPIDLANATLSNHGVAVIMADIDFFKNVNDTYGHLTGDYVLNTFAKLLSSGLKREGDWVARYGGEEFLITIPGASKAVATDIAENLRESLENYEMSFGEYRFKVTASFGVYHVKPTSDMKIEEMIEQADKKLYKAKHNGRNRVEA